MTHHSPFSDKNKIGQAMDNDRSLTLLNDLGKDGECWWQAVISTRENIDIGTFLPGNVDGCVDSFLHILTVKVEWCRLFVKEGSTDVDENVNCSLEYATEKSKYSREPKYVPENRESIKNPVDIESWINS
jgi:hypothetical protein